MTNAIEELIRAARDVVNKWDSPAWGGRHLQHTADYINRLRHALAAVEQQATQPAQNVVELRDFAESIMAIPDNYELADISAIKLGASIALAATQPTVMREKIIGVLHDSQALQKTYSRMNEIKVCGELADALIAAGLLKVRG